ncbi:ankyrin repeat domain-containing protein [Paenibacillus odorifer]|uniref:ankyrin repeat domain-containing protein n=1 Tax=Paenibacillus odorifer TaxID=189426 RepID=UPI00096C7BC7|nr:ankyrin repeat domain-containing protein [Paenibacillus odorifer]OMD78247.1 hypothetical protein BSK50_10895 [Paenibacillus odorifer]
MKKIPTFALGLIVGITLTAGTAVGAATYLKATPKTVKIVVGSNQKSVEAMNVQNKLYVPVRDAGDSFGYSVSGVTSSTVTFAEGVTTNSAGTGTNAGNENTSSTKAGGEYVQDLHKKYSTDGKLDAEKIKAALAAKEITINVQDKETGNSLLHYVVLEDNFAVFSVIKVNALNVNLQNKEGQTALILAVIEKSDFYTSEMKNLKAKATIKDNSGKQAIEYAEKNSAIETGLTTYMFFNKE